MSITQKNDQEYLDSNDVPFEIRRPLLLELDGVNKILWVYRGFKKQFERHILHPKGVRHPRGTTFKILEIGGGSGGLAAQLIPFLEKNHYKVDYHILDIHTDILEWAQRDLKSKGVNIHIHNGGDLHLKIFEDQSFDFVISLHVLHHIHPASVLEEALFDVMRVTRDRFLMADFRRSYIGLFAMRTTKFFLRYSNILFQDSIKSIYRAYTPDEMQLILDHAKRRSPAFTTTIKSLFAPYQIIYGHRQNT